MTCNRMSSMYNVAINPTATARKSKGSFRYTGQGV